MTSSFIMNDIKQRAVRSYDMSNVTVIDSVDYCLFYPDPGVVLP
jgi:hypothetical protein